MKPKFFFVWVCTLAAVLSSSKVFAADNALRTDENGFFRTTQTSAEISSLDGSFTIEFWFKASGSGVLVNEVDAFDIRFWDYSLLELTDTGQLLIGLPGIVGAAEIGSITFGSWNHVAIRYDAGNQTYEALLNGESGLNSLTGIRQMPSTSEPTPSQRLAYIAFGRNAAFALAQGGPMAGDFDEVRIWSAAISDADIQNNRNVTEIPAVDWLKSYWHLDEGTGNNLADASGHQHPGLSVGANWVGSTLSLSGAPVIISTSDRMQEQTALITAVIDPAGRASSAYIEYGATTDYSFATASAEIPAQNGEFSVEFSLTNLTAGFYHYRVVATNSVAGTVGPDSTLTVTNLSGLAARVTGTNYVRSEKLSRPFFTNAAITVEFSFFATEPGVLVNEVDNLDVTRWDYSLMEILADGTLVAGLPNVPTISLGKIAFEQWYNAVLRYDPATSVLDVFLDGVKVGSSTGTRSLPWDYQRSVYLCLGRGGPDNLGGGAFFEGRFDEVRIWRTAVPDAELSVIRNAIISGFQSDLFAYWRFESVADNFSPDSSANQNRAFFVNGVELDLSGLNLRFDLRPSAATGAVVDVIGTTAILSGTAYSQDTNAIAYFEWNFGTMTNHTEGIPITGGTNTSVQTPIGGLEGGTVYTYSLVVSNSTGVVRGQPVTFLKLGWAGYALSLGTNGYLRTFSDQRPFFPDESITVEIWVKPKRHGVVMSETDRISSAALDVSLIEILADGTVVAGFPGVPAISLGTVILEEWNNIVLRYNKTALKMDGFVNGVASSTSSSGDRNAGWEAGRSIIHTFGKSTINKLGSGQSMPAEWDEIRMWNVARSDEEIRLSFNRKIAAGNASLVAYWRFDDRSSNVIDSSGRNNRGQIVGAAQFTVSGAPVSVLITPVQVASDGTVNVQHVGTPGAIVRVEGTSDFQTWTTGPTAAADSLGVASFNVGKSSDAEYRFFRFRQL